MSHADFSHPDEQGRTFIAGEEVRISAGPFEGFSAEVQEFNPITRMVLVAVRMYGRLIELNVPSTQVDKI